MKELYKYDYSQNVKASEYLDISQLLLLLPVPNRQDVIVSVIHSAEVRAAILRGKTQVRRLQILKMTELVTKFKFAHRLRESHAGDCSVKHPHPDYMERVEAHRVPHTHMRGEQLSRQVTGIQRGFIS